MLYLCIVFGGIADDALKQASLLRIAFFDLLIQLLVSPKIHLVHRVEEP